MSEWIKSPVQIVEEIDNMNDMCWDTDSNIAILIGYIMEYGDPRDFEDYVVAVAEEELAQILRMEREGTDAD